MRLKKEESVFLKQNICKSVAAANVLLFGSRTDDNKKGGDIDILVLSNREMSLSEIIKVKVAFWKRFGEQRLDIVSFTYEDKSPFKYIALENAIEL